MPYVNDMEPRFRFAWEANVSAMVGGGLNTEYVFLTCYADFKVNEYLLGAGTDTLAIAYDTGIRMPSYGLYERAYAAGALEDGAKLTDVEYEARLQGVVNAATKQLSTALENRESVVFLAPMGAHGNVAVEAWQAVAQWDLQRAEDGTVNAVRYGVPEGDAEHTQTLANLTSRVTTASTTDSFAGKRIANVSGLTQHYRDIGAYDDITPDDGMDNPFTPAQPPPPCGLAVPDQADNPGLMQDCTALLAAKDALRGTASLNWSVERPISEWDGVTTGRTPLRVVRLELPGKGLTGSVPAELGSLSGLRRLDLSGNRLTGALPAELGDLSNLLRLRLAGNSFTRCIPAALQDVGDNDLHRLTLPYCEPCVTDMGGLPAGGGSASVEEQGWDTSCDSARFSGLGYRTHYYVFSLGESSLVRLTGDSTSDDFHISLLEGRGKTGRRIGALGRTGTGSAERLGARIFEERLQAGEYTVELRTRFPDEATHSLTVQAFNAPPVFAEDSYAFVMDAAAPVNRVVGTVSASDADSDAVSYAIVAGNQGGAFAIGRSDGRIHVHPGIDRETESYTFTVEADDGRGGTARAVITITLLPLPPKPQNLTVSVDNGQVALSWDAPPSDATVTSYRILRRQPPGERDLQTLVENTGSTSTTYVDSSVTSGATYHYRVIGLNAAGAGPVSDPATAVVPP